MPRVRMLGTRKVAKDKAQLIAQGASNLAHGRVRATAKWALEITVLDQRDRGVRRPDHMVSLCIHRGTQLARGRSFHTRSISSTLCQMSVSLSNRGELRLFGDWRRDSSH